MAASPISRLVFATTDRSLGPAAIAGFVRREGQPRDAPGRKEKKMGVRASHTAQVILEDCFVPEEARLGTEADGTETGPGALGP